MNETQHVPVLLESVLASLRLAPGMTVVDATLGGGGYSKAILERILPAGKLIALDWDEEAISRFLSRGAHDAVLSDALREGNLILKRCPFSELQSALEEEGIGSVGAIAADLGLSSDQLMDPRRGLSFQSDGPLDMRLDLATKVTAADIIKEWSLEQLTELLRTYGDEREARRIARTIVRERTNRSITRTGDLADIVSRSVSPWRRHSRIHPATKTFQALRIMVNGELRELERFLPQAAAMLEEGGRLSVVTFHSGEDKIVKRFIDDQSRGCTCGLVPCICHRKPLLIKVTRKPIVPTGDEVERNPRSRSAKLRVAEKKRSSER